jgi:hypothetical protein
VELFWISSVAASLALGVPHCPSSSSLTTNGKEEREREKERFLSWFLMGADMTSFGQNFGASQVCLKEKDISTQNE